MTRLAVTPKDLKYYATSVLEPHVKALNQLTQAQAASQVPPLPRIAVETGVYTQMTDRHHTLGEMLNGLVGHSAKSHEKIMETAAAYIGVEGANAELAGGTRHAEEPLPTSARVDMPALKPDSPPDGNDPALGVDELLDRLVSLARRLGIGEQVESIVKKTRENLVDPRPHRAARARQLDYVRYIDDVKTRLNNGAVKLASWSSPAANRTRQQSARSQQGPR